MGCFSRSNMVRGRPLNSIVSRIMTAPAGSAVSPSHCLWAVVVCAGVIAPCYAGGPSPLFGLATLLHRLAVFVGVQICVATILAVVSKRGSRRRVFLLALGIWFVWCFAVEWGPPLVEVILAVVRGDAWGSYSQPYPGHVHQYLRYVMVNRLPPTPSAGIVIASVVVAALFVHARKTRSRAPAG